MYRIMQIDAINPPQVLLDTDAIAPPPEGVLRWIDLGRQHDEELALLGQRFNFHPLTIEDCANFNQRPKYENYDGYLFIVMHGFEFGPQPEEALEAHELHSFLGKNFLVTVHDESIGPLNAVWDRLLTDPTTARRGVDFIRYLIADAMADALFPLVDQLANQVEEIEDALLAHAAGESALEEIL
ncbi:MAG: CorA family divalent cation transporter, partial [Candidatus Hydrogenedentales bacterium]